MKTVFSSNFQAISRLGGQSMKKECDDLKVKILDQSNQETMELNKLIESLKIAKEDTVPWNIRGKYLRANNLKLSNVC